MVEEVVKESGHGGRETSEEATAGLWAGDPGLGCGNGLGQAVLFADSRRRHAWGLCPGQCPLELCKVL